MDVFVTGGTGFIGSYVVNELLSRGHKVTILARNPGKIPSFAQNPNIRIINGHIRDHEAIVNGLYKKDGCIHIALGRHRTSVEAVEEDVLPAVDIFETAALMGVKKIITTTSIATFGSLGRPFGENVHTRPANAYGALKAAAEAYLFATAEVYGIQGNMVSPGLTIGTPLCEGATIYNDPGMHAIIDRVLKNEDVSLVKGAGTQFIWVGDLAKIYSAALESNLNRRIFIGVGKEVVLWEEVARMAIQLAESKSEVLLEEREDAASGMSCYPIDISPIKEEFGYEFVSRDRLREQIGYLLKLKGGK
ncbi:MAG: NAD(P)-dependent oxidoreductase [Clostridiales bacterium]|jgi:UDP-glucose 4-epimerase|nr:NAD(P)-dependent oxidoreductase [Clostridiales bacterium]